jgi:hypothetical protein
MDNCPYHFVLLCAVPKEYYDKSKNIIVSKLVVLPNVVVKWVGFMFYNW